MRRIPLEYAILAVAFAATAAVVLPARAQSAAADTDKVARGKYLVTTSGCHDCHTPWVMGPKGPEPDMSASSGEKRRRRRARRFVEQHDTFSMRASMLAVVATGAFFVLQVARSLLPI